MMESTGKRRDRWRDEAIKKWQKLWSWQRILLSLGGRMYVRHEQLIPGKPHNPETGLYMFYCPEHDIVDIDYEHGYDKRLDCSLCGLHRFAESAPTPFSPPTQPLAA